MQLDVIIAIAVTGIGAGLHFDSAALGFAVSGLAYTLMPYRRN